MSLCSLLTLLLHSKMNKLKMSLESISCNRLIHKGRVQGSFPNVEIALRMYTAIYLVLMISNCSAERSFLKMKLIKNRLRTSMCNDQLSHVALMSVEVDILRQINFEDLVTEFSKKKE